MVEADYAVDVGAAQVQALRDQLFGLAIDAAEFGLDVVQDRHQRAFSARVRGDNLANPLFLSAHLFSLSACQAMCSAMNVVMKKYEWS